MWTRHLNNTKFLHPIINIRNIRGVTDSVPFVFQCAQYHHMKLKITLLAASEEMTCDDYEDHVFNSYLII